MEQSIAYTSRYAGELDKMITQESKTGFFSDNAFKARFTGAREVYLPELSMVGLGKYDRITGYAKGDATLTHTKYTLSQERSRQLFIDAQDADESGVPDLAGKMVGEYTRTKVIPEIDAYVIEKLYTKAAEEDAESGKTAHVTTYAEDTAVKDFISVINDAEASMEYDGSTQLVALVDTTLYNQLMTSPELQRYISIDAFRQGNVNLKVKNLNGCAVIPVTASRMRTKFKYDDGAESGKGGFSVDDGAGYIRALVLPKDSASLIKKVDKVNMFAPNEVIDRDGYVINFRLYYDLFVKKSRQNTIFAITSEA